mmetsp:Transcript_44356/g.141183  ORF Transcript_44356/g.141183 Transcript_44356/m.141183 type:complete len:201 (-) Transcript_44356:516-1118(-)
MVQLHLPHQGGVPAVQQLRRGRHRAGARRVRRGGRGGGELEPRQRAPCGARRHAQACAGGRGGGRALAGAPGQGRCLPGGLSQGAQLAEQQRRPRHVPAPGRRGGPAAHPVGAGRALGGREARWQRRGGLGLEEPQAPCLPRQGTGCQPRGGAASRRVSVPRRWDRRVGDALQGPRGPRLPRAGRRARAGPSTLPQRGAP